MKNNFFYFIFTVLLASSSFAKQPKQLDLNLNDSISKLKHVSIYSDNLKQTYDIPEEITKAWDERDFGFEMGDGYYDVQSMASYEILDTDGSVMGYMLAASLTYTEDPEYYVAYTISDVYGVTIVELESYLVEMEDLRPELRFNIEE